MGLSGGQDKRRVARPQPWKHAGGRKAGRLSVVWGGPGWRGRADAPGSNEWANLVAQTHQTGGLATGVKAHG